MQRWLTGAIGAIFIALLVATGCNASSKNRDEDQISAAQRWQFSIRRWRRAGQLHHAWPGLDRCSTMAFLLLTLAQSAAANCKDNRASCNRGGLTGAETVGVIFGLVVAGWCCYLRHKNKEGGGFGSASAEPIYEPSEVRGAPSGSLVSDTGLKGRHYYEPPDGDAAVL